MYKDMSDSEYNLPTGENPDDVQLHPDAKPVCPNCLTEVDPLQDYCFNCDSNMPVNPLTSYMPFADLRFRVGGYAKMWRKVLDNNEPSTVSRFLCLGMLIFFIPIFVVIAIPLLLIDQIKNPTNKKDAT